MMIKSFARLVVNDSGDIKCSKCGKVLAHSTPDYFHKNTDASDVWMLQLSDDHFLKDICSAVMDDAKDKYAIVKQHSNDDVTVNDIYSMLAK